MKIEIKNRFTGKVIFELDAENNSITLTAESAIKSKTNLRSADLYGADLSDADLSGADLKDVNLCGANLSDADLSGADLSGANLYGANLSDADLSGANLYDVNLRDANLSGANLYGADLSGANLRDAAGNKKEVRTIQVDTYSIAFTDSILQIGCRRYTHQEWRDFTDDEISKMDSGALDWWKKWKDFIFIAIELSFNNVTV